MENSLDSAVIRKLQEELPLVPEPYKCIAEELGITERELFDKINELRDKKMLRRIGAVLHHRTVGFKANAMVVWAVPEDRIIEVTNIMITFPQVSHCYERKPLPNWSYNIYTMIHSGTFEDCEAVILKIARMVRADKYEVLYSIRELKKSSMKYFID
jgi:DNA-binding Lrp family transcriptional regulator